MCLAEAGMGEPKPVHPHLELSVLGGWTHDHKLETQKMASGDNKIKITVSDCVTIEG